MKDTQVVILAGGLATRLGRLACDRPKSLIVVGGKPFLEHQLDLLRRAGVGEVLLCVGHLGSQIQGRFPEGCEHGVRLRYSFEDRPLGTAGALKNAQALLADTFLCMYGDSYLPMDFAPVVRHFRDSSKLALMTVYRNHGRYDWSNAVVDGGLVTRYDKQARSPEMVHIDYGANVLRRAALDAVPDDCFYSLEWLLSELVARQELLAYEVDQRFYEIGSARGIKDLEEYLSRAQ